MYSEPLLKFRFIINVIFSDFYKYLSTLCCVLFIFWNKSWNSSLKLCQRCNFKLKLVTRPIVFPYYHPVKTYSSLHYPWHAVIQPTDSVWSSLAITFHLDKSKKWALISNYVITFWKSAQVLINGTSLKFEDVSVSGCLSTGKG